jgi:hypothetical protein
MRILAAHLADQIPNVLGNRRPSGLTVTDLPSPEQAEALPMPGDHSLRLDDDEGGTPPAQTLDSHAQKNRSAAVSLGRFAER